MKEKEKQESEKALQDALQLERTTLARERTVFARERNQLAAERTFSAWIRTGLAGVGGGLALVRFIQFKDPTKYFIAHLTGGILLLWGFAVIIFALWSYRRNIRKIEIVNGDEISRVGVTSIALILLLISVLVFLLAQD